MRVLPRSQSITANPAARSIGLGVRLGIIETWNAERIPVLLAPSAAINLAEKVTYLDTCKCIIGLSSKNATITKRSTSQLTDTFSSILIVHLVCIIEIKSLNIVFYNLILILHFFLTFAKTRFTHFNIKVINAK